MDADLPAGARDEIAGLVAAALATIPPGGSAGATVTALMTDVQARYGWAGVYAAAYAAARMATHGIAADPRLSGSQAATFTDEREGPQPSTPAGYRVSRFITAVLGEDEAAARAEFEQWRADPAVMTETVGRLLHRAWSRQAGGELLWNIRPGQRWPPECDFCCRATARHMFRCRPFQLTGTDPSGGSGALGLNYTDSAHWYACGACASMFERDQFVELLRRYRRLNGPPSWEGHDHNLLHLWRQAAAHRQRARRYPLPGQRPQT